MSDPLSIDQIRLQVLRTYYPPRYSRSWDDLGSRSYNRQRRFTALQQDSNDQPFLCGICEGSFGSQVLFDQHAHFVEKKLVCSGNLSDGNPWGCYRRFTGVGALIQHFWSETGQICLRPVRDDDISQGIPERVIQEHLTNSESHPPRSEKLTLPASLFAAYPALAQVIGQECLQTALEEEPTGHSIINLSNHTSGHDWGYVSDPLKGFAILNFTTSVPNGSRPSKMLDTGIARIFAVRFARYLADRSAAYVWGESVLARLSYDIFVSQLNTVLRIYPFDSSQIQVSNHHVSLKHAIRQTREAICARFYTEIQMRFSSPEVILKDLHVLRGFSKPTDNPIFDTSFDFLSLLVRERLYSAPRQSMDPAEAALGGALDVESQNSGIFLGSRQRRPTTPKRTEINIETRLTLLDYIEKNFSNKSVELSTLITITGTAFYAYATTCIDYLKWAWPNTGDALLPILQEAVQKVFDRPGESAEVVKEIDPLRTLSVLLSRNGAMILRIEGPKDFGVNILQQLSWLAAAFSVPPLSTEGVYYSMPRIEFISPLNLAETTNLKLGVCFTSLDSSERGSCWLSLFPNVVVAYGFPIPDRADGMGLEMSVELMAAIIGARHAPAFDGGIVIKGFSSIFVPVKRTKGGIQWHYVANSDPELQLSYEEGVKRCSNRMLLPDFDFASLATTRCFIGWNSLVEILVGDEMTDFGNIEFSDAPEVKAALQIPSASLGFQQFGLAQIDMTFGKRDGKCHFQRSSSYRRIVSAADKMLIALYDTGERRSCLVPASGLVLHILRHRISSGLGGVPASKVKILSAGSPAETLLKNSKLRLTPEGDDPLIVEDVVTEIWSVLELLQAQSISAEKNSKIEIHATWQERLLGYEYKAVVEDRSPMPLKELDIHKTCGGWPKLVRDVNALVLLANGFGDLIRPIDSHVKLCHQWKILPPDKDYMAVPVKVLLSLYSLAGCHESKKRLTATNLQLHSRSLSTFLQCPTPEERQCSCNRLQQVVSNSSFGQICVPELIEGNGAVIIGESGSLLSRIMKKSAPKTTETRGHDRTISDGEVAGSSLNSDTSRSSIGPESSSSDFRHSKMRSPVSSVDIDCGVSTKALDSMRTGKFSFRNRGNRILAEMADSSSTLSPNSANHLLRPRQKLRLDGSLRHENLLTDESRS